MPNAKVTYQLIVAVGAGCTAGTDGNVEEWVGVRHRLGSLGVSLGRFNNRAQEGRI